MLCHIGLEGVLHDGPQGLLVPLANQTRTPNPIFADPYIQTPAFLLAEMVSKPLRPYLAAHETSALRKMMGASRLFGIRFAGA